jgi:hypothetical protein
MCVICARALSSAGAEHEFNNKTQIRELFAQGLVL